MAVRAVAYSRVSTLLGQDPENQLVPIRDLVRNRGFQLGKEYIDFISGTSERRKALDELVKDARLGKFKVLVIYSLDRLARDTRFLLNLLHELDGYGISVISIRESMDLSTAVGKAVMQILGSIAELERNLISERIKTALAVKKLTNEKSGGSWRCGRPPLSAEIIEAIEKLRKSGKSIRSIAKELGIGKTSVERVLRRKR